LKNDLFMIVGEGKSTMFKVMKKIIQYPRLTQNYPDKPVDSRLFIGNPEVNHKRCTKCEECIKRCPSHSIVKREADQMIGINYDCCIFCGLCEEICPSVAIKMTNKFELAEKDRNALRASTLIVEESDLPHNAVDVIGSMPICPILPSRGKDRG